MKDLKGKTVRSGLLSVSVQFAMFFLRAGSLVVLARLLVPRDFGLVGMVTAITGVLATFKDAGLGAVTIQRASISEKQIFTLFWLNMLIGALLFGLSLATAPLLVAFYHEPRLFWVTAILSSGFVASGATAQHQALLQRQMRFGALAAVEILSLSISIAVGVAMAVSGYGYWALVGMSVTLPTVYCVFVWLVAAWIPGLPRRNVGARSMLHFGGALGFGNLITYFANNADKILLGRVWGAEALGIYGRGYQLISIPTQNLNTSLGSVAVAALSRLQNDPDRFRNYFIKGYSLLLALSLPMTFACALFADEIVFVALGPKWMDVAPIFRLLAPTVAVLALINPLYWVLVSMGLADKTLKMTLVVTPLMIAGYGAGLAHGPTGVAFGYSAVMLLLVVPMMAWARHNTFISWGDIWQAVYRPLLSVVVAAGIALGMQLLYGRSLPSFARLALGVAVLSTLYLWLLLGVMGQKAMYLDIFRSLRRRSSDD